MDGQLTIPGDLYPDHDYTPDEFGQCVGCGLDLWATCHPLPPVADPVRQHAAA